MRAARRAEQLAPSHPGSQKHARTGKPRPRSRRARLHLRAALPPRGPGSWRTSRARRRVGDAAPRPSSGWGTRSGSAAARAVGRRRQPRAARPPQHPGAHSHCAVCTRRGRAVVRAHVLRPHIGPSNPSAHRQVATPDGASTPPRPSSRRRTASPRACRRRRLAHAGPCHPARRRTRRRKAGVGAHAVARARERARVDAGQLSPEKPGTHSHAPPRQTPAPEQSSGRSRRSAPLTSCWSGRRARRADAPPGSHRRRTCCSRWGTAPPRTPSRPPRQRHALPPRPSETHTRAPQPCGPHAAAPNAPWPGPPRRRRRRRGRRRRRSARRRPSAHAHAPPAHTPWPHAAPLNVGPAMRAPRGAPGRRSPGRTGAARRSRPRPPLRADAHVVAADAVARAQRGAARARPPPLRAPPGRRQRQHRRVRDKLVAAEGRGRQSSPEYPGAHAHLPS